MPLLVRIKNKLDKKLSAQDAYQILHKKYPTDRLRACLDFGTFYVFTLAPFYINDDDEYMPGTVLDAIDKRTGKIFEYDIASDIDAYEKAKAVQVDTIMDTKLKDIKYNG